MTTANAAEIGAAYVAIRGDLSGLSKDLNTARSMITSQLSGMTASLGSLGGSGSGGGLLAGLAGLSGAGTVLAGIATGVGAIAVAGAGLVAAGGLIGILGLREAIPAAAEAEMVQTKLEAVLRATGHAAGFTGQQLADMATEMQKASTFGDEEIKSSMALLATFRSVAGQEFERATRAAMDLASTGFGSLESASVALGKALESPLDALTSLRRMGVSFSQLQRDAIKKLVEGGDLEGAQRTILDAVEQQVGGVSQAIAGTFSGVATQMKNWLGDVFEEAGKPFLGMLKPILADFRDFFMSMTSFDFAGLFGGFGNSVSLVRDSIRNMLDSVKGFLFDNAGTFATWGNLAGETISNLVRVVQQGMASLGGMAGGLNLWEPLKRGISGVLDTLSLLTTDFGKTWELIQLGGQLAFSQLSDFMTLRFPREVQGASAGLIEAMKIGWKHLVDFMNSEMGASSIKIVGQLQGIMDAFKVMHDYSVGLYQSMLGKIGKALGKAGELVIGGAQLAAGGAPKAMDALRAAQQEVAGQLQPGMDVARQMAQAFAQQRDLAMQGAVLEGERTRKAREALGAKLDEIAAQRELNRLINANKQQIAAQIGAIGLGAGPMGGLAALAPAAAMGPAAPVQMGGPGGNLQALAAQLQAARDAVAQGARQGVKDGQVTTVKEFHRTLQEGLLRENNEIPKQQLEEQKKTLKFLEERFAKELAKAMPRGIGIFGN